MTHRTIFWNAPMSDKYPSMTPYNYCANNQVILVDPDGRDVFTFNENGELIGQDKDKKGYDQVVVKKSDGTSVEGEKYKFGTMKNKFEETVNQENGNKIQVPFFEITDDNKAIDIFKFMAVNSSVEWAITRVGSKSGKEGKSFLSSSRETKGEFSSGILTNRYQIRFLGHSHPSGIPKPSQGDCNHALGFFLTGQTNVNFFVYGKRNSISSYIHNTFELNSIIDQISNQNMKNW